MLARHSALQAAADFCWAKAENDGAIAAKTIPQIALAWLLSRPTVASVVIGARDETQLLDNLGAVGWSLTAEQIARLDKASAGKAEDYNTNDYLP